MTHSRSELEPNDWVAYVNDEDPSTVVHVDRFVNTGRGSRRPDPPYGGWDPPELEIV